MPEGYNAKVTAFMMEIMPKEPLDTQDVAEMERRFMNYVQKCSEWDMKVGNQAAYMAIGITKEQAWEWENVVKGNPARSDFVKKVRQFCGVFREGLMQDGKVNPVTGIFWQKNYDGMKDQTEMVLTPNNPLGEQKDMKALEQKYLESAYDGSEVAEGTFAEIAESPEGAEGRQPLPACCLPCGRPLASAAEFHHAFKAWDMDRLPAARGAVLLPWCRRGRSAPLCGSLRAFCP